MYLFVQDKLGPFLSFTSMIDHVHTWMLTRADYNHAKTKHFHHTHTYTHIHTCKCTTYIHTYLFRWKAWISLKSSWLWSRLLRYVPPLCVCGKPLQCMGPVFVCVCVGCMYIHIYVYIHTCIYSPKIAVKKVGTYIHTYTHTYTHLRRLG